MKSRLTPTTLLVAVLITFFQLRAHADVSAEDAARIDQCREYYDVILNTPDERARYEAKRSIHEMLEQVARTTTEGVAKSFTESGINFGELGRLTRQAERICSDADMSIADSQARDACNQAEDASSRAHDPMWDAILKVAHEAGRVLEDRFNLSISAYVNVDGSVQFLMVSSDTSDVANFFEFDFFVKDGNVTVASRSELAHILGCLKLIPAVAAAN